MINDDKPTKLALAGAVVIYIIVLIITFGLTAVLITGDNPIQILFTFR